MPIIKGNIRKLQELEPNKYKVKIQQDRLLGGLLELLKKTE